MGGIGFELKKLFSATGILSRLRAYGYTGMVTAGPMLLGVSFLLTISAVAKWAGVSEADTDLMVSIITYSLLGSMMHTSIFSMVMTRFVADLLYAGKDEDILPSLEGVLWFILPTGAVLWVVFLFFSGLSVRLCFLVFVLFMELLTVWTQMNYLSAIKDYKGIVMSYVAAILTSTATAFIGTYLAGGSLEVMMFGIVMGYGVMMAVDMALLYRFFPNSNQRHFDFLPWFDEYRELVIISFFTNVGLFSHLVIAWFSSIGRCIKGLFYAAPQHDIAALFAFMTILITTINFVVSVEVNLYPKYRKYYDLFNGKGSIVEIEQAESEMLTVLEHELIYTARRQLYATAIMLSVGLVVLSRLPLGFDAMMEGYFRILCVGYGAYAVGNAIIMILMYFTDYRDTLTATLIFAILSTAGCLFSLRFEMRFYGFAFAFASIIYLVAGIWMLASFTKRLPYHILSTQPMLAEPKYGIATRLYEKILEKEKKYLTGREVRQ